MKYKLICFDLDGTIIDDTIFIWQTIHDFLKTDVVERAKAFEAYKQKKITYAEWAGHDLMLWKQCGVNKAKLMEAIKPLKLMPGAEETLKELKKRGYKLAIISGSLNIALEKTLPNYKEYFDDILLNWIYFDDKGNLVDSKFTKFDNEGKADGLKFIVKREKIPIEQTVFVGDNYNDVHIAKEAGLSIAFNCKSEELAKISDVVIKKKDLREILKYL